MNNNYLKEKYLKLENYFLNNVGCDDEKLMYCFVGLTRKRLKDKDISNLILRYALGDNLLNKLLKHRRGHSQDLIIFLIINKKYIYLDKERLLDDSLFIYELTKKYEKNIIIMLLDDILLIDLINIICKY